jgi:hypothetical protein
MESAGVLTLSTLTGLTPLTVIGKPNSNICRSVLPCFPYDTQNQEGKNAV